MTQVEEHPYFERRGEDLYTVVPITVTEAALGAKIAAPARAILALAGDFGLQFTLNELMTAVEENLSLPIVVWNNSALGQIRDDMQASAIPLTGVIARNPDFVALGAAYGAAAVRVTDAKALTETIRAAFTRSGPTLIEVIAPQFSPTRA